MCLVVCPGPSGLPITTSLLAFALIRTVLALLAGIAITAWATARLVAINSDIKRELERLPARRAQALGSPTAGSLVGQNAADGSSWPSQNAGSELRSSAYVVLFPVTRTSNFEFWRELSRHSKAMGMEIEFAGVCIDFQTCSPQQARAAAPITLLSAMDPLQMRAVAVASSKKEALLYQAGKFIGPVTVNQSAENIAQSILKPLTRKSGTE